MGFRVLKRGKFFYIRVWVPLDVRHVIKRRELKKSLQTEKRAEARVLAIGLQHKVETAFMRIRTGMLSDRELEQLSVSILAEFSGRIDEHRKLRKDAFTFFDDGAPIGIDYNYDLPAIEASFDFPRNPATATSHYTQRIQWLENQRATGVFSPELRRDTARMIEAKGLDVDFPPAEWFDENSSNWLDAPPANFAQVCEAIIDGLIEAYSLELQRVQGKRDAVREATLSARIEAARPKPKLSDLWQAYSKAKQIKGKWGASTARKNQDTYNEAIEILGDKELAEYTQDQVLDYLSALKKKGNSASTVTGKVEFISSMYRHALKTPESIEQWQVRGNPFTEMQVQDTVPVDEKKTPFTGDDIHELLTGLLNVRKLVDPHRYWVPLIALYTGMRQNEICQLRTEDISVIDGIVVFCIRHNPALQQTTKAREGRVCPVHPMLKRLGFIEYLECQRNKNQDRLFSKLTYTDGKKWCGKIRGWFNESFMNRHVSDTSSKSFHSFRGSFINQFKQCKLFDTPSDRAVVQSMVGHDGDDSVTSKHYEQKFPVTTQMAMLRKLDYGIDPDLIDMLCRKKY